MPPKSDVWNFFNKEDKNSAKCLLCKLSFKTSANTSNLRDHLLRRHRDVYKVKPTSKPTGAGTSSFGEAASTSSKSDKSACMDITSYYDATPSTSTYSKTNLRKKELDSAVVEMLCTDMQPFYTVERKGFKKMFKKIDPRYKLPDRKVLSKSVVPALYNEVKGLLVEELKNAEYLSATTDMWTSIKGDCYISITIHFINKEWELKSGILKTAYMPERHTAINISQALNDAFAEYEITSKVVCIVSDNASNMINAVHACKIKHLNCFAHTLQLTVRDALKFEPVVTIIEKAKAIVAVFKASNVASEVLRAEQIKQNKPVLMVIQDVATRWNSTFFMLQRILEIGDPLILSLTKLDTTRVNYFTSEEIKIIHDLVTILDTFQKVTEDISGQQYVTVSLIIPLVYGLTKELQLMVNKLRTDTGKKFLDLLVASVSSRLYPYETRTITAMATLLDPRWKKKAFLNDANAKNAHTWLQNALASITKAQEKASTDESTSVAMSTEIDTPASEIQEPSTRNRSSVLIHVQHKKDEDMQQRTRSADSIINVQNYLQQHPLPNEARPLQFWREKQQSGEFNQLYNVAKKYLCVPGSSVPSERVFSSAGKVISEQRTRLSQKKAEMLVFLSGNIWLKEQT